MPLLIVDCIHLIYANFYFIYSVYIIFYCIVMSYVLYIHAYRPRVCNKRLCNKYINYCFVSFLAQSQPYFTVYNHLGTTRL